MMIYSTEQMIEIIRRSFDPLWQPNLSNDVPLHADWEPLESVPRKVWSVKNRDTALEWTWGATWLSDSRTRMGYCAAWEFNDPESNYSLQVESNRQYKKLRRTWGPIQYMARSADFKKFESYRVAQKIANERIHSAFLKANYGSNF